MIIPSAALASDVFVVSGSAPSSDFELVVFCFVLSAGLRVFLFSDEIVLVPLVSIGGGFEVLVLMTSVTLSASAAVDVEVLLVSSTVLHLSNVVRFSVVVMVGVEEVVVSKHSFSACNQMVS